MLFNPALTRHAKHSNRKPWQPSKLKTGRVTNAWRLNKQRHLALVASTVVLMDRAELTPFAVEAPRRYELRTTFCLQGWPWRYADQEAEAIVNAALKRVGAQRPPWIEGQPEYCDQGYLRDDRCWQCGEPLPRYRKKWCSEPCTRIGNRLRLTNMFDMML